MRVLQQLFYYATPSAEPSYRTPKVLQNSGGQGSREPGPVFRGPVFVPPRQVGPECTKIARFSAVAVAIFTAPPQNRAILRAQDARFPLRRKSLANRDFLCD